MRTILYRYLIKEQLVPFSLCLLGATFILITGRLVQLTRHLFTSSVTVFDIVKLIALAMPNLILYAIPMAALLSTLLAFLRLNSDNELIVLRASGTSFFQLLPPVLCVLCLFTVLSFYNALVVVPAANQAFENNAKRLGKASLPAFLKEGTFIDIIPNLVFYFQSVDASNMSMSGIFIQDQRQSNVRMAIVAEQAKVITKRNTNYLAFKLSNGIITRVTDNLKDAQTVNFKVYDLSLSLDEIFANSNKGEKSRREMTLKELYGAMKKPEQRKDISMALEFHRRLSLPSACFFLGLVGAPLGALFRRQSRMAGITFGMCIFLIYYVILSAGKGLGENRIISPFFAVWTANIFCFVVGCYLWNKMQHETPFPLAKVWHRLLSHIPTIRVAWPLRKKHGI